MLGDEAIAMAKGSRIRVRTTAELGGSQPRYTFEAWWRRDGAEDDEPWHRFGEAVHYPEAALNCNDAMDCMMAGD